MVLWTARNHFDHVQWCDFEGDFLDRWRRPGSGAIWPRPMSEWLYHTGATSAGHDHEHGNEDGGTSADALARRTKCPLSANRATMSVLGQPSARLIHGLLVEGISSAGRARAALVGYAPALKAMPLPGIVAQHTDRRPDAAEAPVLRPLCAADRRAARRCASWHELVVGRGRQRPRCVLRQLLTKPAPANGHRCCIDGMAGAVTRHARLRHFA